MPVFCKDTGVDTGDVTLEDSEQDSDSGQDSQVRCEGVMWQLTELLL